MTISPATIKAVTAGALALLVSTLFTHVASAEGSEQTGSDELMTDEANGETLLLMDVLPGDAFLNIAGRAAGGGSGEVDVRVTAPGGTATTYSLTAGAGLLAATMPAQITNPLRIDVSTAPGVYQIQFLTAETYPYDIAVSANNTDPIDPTAVPAGGGRLHATSWHISGELPSTNGFVVDQRYFVRVPVGTDGDEYLWQMDLGGIAGGHMCVVANELGLPGSLARSSQTLAAVNTETGLNRAARDYCADLAQFPIYLNPPNSLGPQPTAPTLTFSGIGGCGALIEGAGGSFEFNADLPSTYEIIIDVDRNGFDPTPGSPDTILSGLAVAGANSIPWDGKDRNGANVPTSATPYDARVSLRLGEFHFTAIDVEGTDPGVAVFLVDPADTNSTSPTAMYWNDQAIVGSFTNNIPDPIVAIPDGVMSNVGRHDWGDAATSNGGVGNDAFIDTWVYGAEVVANTTISVADPAADEDSDGLSNARECEVGSLFDDPDTDGDGVSDGAEVPATGPVTDTDGDTIPDVFDVDDDGDGILTADESPDPNTDLNPTDALDSDGDGVPNYLDDDDDGDGIPTADEDIDGNDDPQNDDTDGDGTPNYLDDDDDGDGVPTADEDIDGNTNFDDDDTDGDSTPNYLDPDDDGDGVPTIDEDIDGDTDPTNDDTDGDGVPNYLDDDDDGDGIPTVDEDIDGNDDPENDDTDGDGTPNYLDPDDDGDGVPTTNEDVDGDNDPQNDDTDGDGIPNYLDPDDDGDGVPTVDEDVDGDNNPENDDTDGDGVPNYLDDDDDGDGISTEQEITDANGNDDLDMDGTPNYLDPDSDGDGITDAAENTGDGDVNDDGVPDYLDPLNAPLDSDGDGIPDEVECADISACQDTDGDGSPDNLDPDDDGDGVPTFDERPNAEDVDTDDDGTPNYLDPDDDGDGIPTATERPGDEDIDTDEDGTPDYLDPDDDGDGIPTSRERPDGEDVDTDEDGTPDYLDPDDDRDGVPTRTERPGDEDVDTDGDGIPDYLDPDDDDDSVATSRERPDGEDVDTDEDGIPDYLDPDDDGDSVSTRRERPGNEDVDTDGDGTPDYLDPDDDGDGRSTLAERPGDEDVDTDGDGTPDYLDPDDGGDSGAPAMTTEAGAPMDMDAGAPPDEPEPTDEDSGTSRPPPSDRDPTDFEDPTEEPAIVEGVLEGGGCSCTLPGHDISDRSMSWLNALAGIAALWGFARRRARRSRRTGNPRRIASKSLMGVALLLVLGSAHDARAQEPGFALNRYEAAASSSEWFAGDSLDVRGHNRWSFGLVWDGSAKPLVAYDSDGEEIATIISSQIYTHLGVGVILWETLRVGAGVPVLWYQNGDSAAVNGLTYATKKGVAIGDARLELDVGLAGEYGDPVRVGLGTNIYFPTGNRNAYTSDGGFRFTPHLGASGDIDDFVYSARLGGTLRTETDNFAAEPFGADATFVATAGFRVADKHLLIGPEFWGSTVVSDHGKGIFERRTTSIEGVLGAHYTEGPWRLGLGGGPGFTHGLGTPQFRVLASLQWSEEFAPPPPPPEDSDGDGIFDRDDACPDRPGPSNIDPAKNGCPVEKPPPPADTDGDGIADEEDACPKEPGVGNIDPKKHGCPPPTDIDNDGIWDEEDACVTEPGVASTDPKKHGCPPPADTDGDGVLDDFDACPKEKGPVDKDPKKNGCPRVQVTATQIVILDRVEFDTNKATIRPESDPILQAVFTILSEHPEIEKVRVEGHTDNRGAHGHNIRLSRQRAEAVVQWLVARGIEPSRLRSAGLGPDRPIQSNETEDGRQVNRRVEFHIEKQAANKAPAP